MQSRRPVAAPFPCYRPRQPQDTTLYAVVRDNLETLYGAVDEGAVTIALPAFVKKELEGYLDCGLPCRGFTRPKMRELRRAASRRV